MSKSRIGQGCKVCGHEQRDAIESALVRTTLALVGQKFDMVSSSLGRHRALHMSQELRAAILLGQPEYDATDLEALRKDRSENFLLRIMKATGQLQSIANRQEDDDDLRGAALTYGKIQQWIEMEGRLLGDLNAATLHIRHSFVRSHEWSKLKVIFVRELESHPELSARILGAMRSIQDETETAVPLLEAKPNGCGSYAS